MAIAKQVERWLSGHIFYGRYSDHVCDATILDAVRPFVREGVAAGMFTSYFFIRYDELGPHVRVRVRAPETATRAIEALLAKYVSDHFTTPPEMPSILELPEGSRRSAHPSLIWIPYVPEVERYGGAAGVKVAEDFFRESTDVSFQLLDRIRTGTLDRQGLVLASMVTIMGTMTRDSEAVAAMSKLHSLRFSSSWRDANKCPRGVETEFELGFSTQASPLTNQIAEYWTASAEGLLPFPLDKYAESATAAKHRLAQLVAEQILIGHDGNPVATIGDAIKMVAPIYMHMTNNRLGISNINEAFLGYAMWRVFGDPRFAIL